MRLLVCGARTWWNDQYLWNVLRGFNLPGEELTIIEGEAVGADQCARHWGEVNKRPVLKFPADWNKYGKAAGPIRNKQMLDEGKPDMVLAFVDKPLAESRGTSNMVNQSVKAGLPVLVIQDLTPRPDLTLFEE
jgi:hypothetical protein